LRVARQCADLRQQIRPGSSDLFKTRLHAEYLSLQILILIQRPTCDLDNSVLFTDNFLVLVQENGIAQNVKTRR